MNKTALYRVAERKETPPKRNPAEDSARIAAETKAFLAAGGKVDVVPTTVRTVKEISDMNSRVVQSLSQVELEERRRRANKATAASNRYKALVRRDKGDNQ